MLDSDEDLPASLSKIINNAHLQAIRMDQILNDLLVLSKLEEKGFSENSGETVDVPSLLRRLVSDFQGTKARDTHKIELEVDEIGPSLRYATAQVQRQSSGASKGAVEDAWSAPAAGGVTQDPWASAAPADQAPIEDAPF
jgi:signal transduction histidine kinase